MFDDTNMSTAATTHQIHEQPQPREQLQQQDSPLPLRQPSFIGLPPISPGPNFGSALGITAEDFALNVGDAVAPRDRQSSASPPVPVLPVSVPVPRIVPSPPQSWADSSTSPPPTASNISNSAHSPAGSSGNSVANHSRTNSAANSNINHIRTGSSASVAAQSSPTMYRPSQDLSMHGAYAPVQQPQAEQQQQGQNGAQYVVHGNGFAQQPGQFSAQRGVQYGVNGNGNAYPQHPAQAISQQGAQYSVSNGADQQQQSQPNYYNGTQQYPVNGKGIQQQPQLGPQNGAQYALNGNGHSIQQHPGQPGSQYAVQNGQSGMSAPVSYQQFAARSGAPPNMSSPSLQSNGTFVLPPGWKMEQSHLQQPLTSPRHRASPSISSLRQQKDAYEIDKETGLSTRSVSPPTHSPTDTRRLDHAAQSSSVGESSHHGYAPPRPAFAQEHGSPLGRVSTNNTQSSQGQEDRDGRRNSNMFSSLRTRLGGNGQPGLELTKSSFAVDDGVSEASVLTEEQARKGPGNFFGLRGNGQPASEGRVSYDVDLDRSAFGPSEKKRTFFTRPHGLSLGSSSAQDLPPLSRPATTEGVPGPPPVGFGPGPKKRFSKLTGMLNRDKSDTPLSQAQGYSPNPPPVGRPSLTGQRPLQGTQMGPPGGPENEAQMGTYGLPRSATNESRPSIGDQGRNISAQGLMSPPSMNPILEEDRSRKVSGGKILSNIFGKRPESKSREQQQQSSPPGLGQPQGMTPQGAQGQTPPRPGQPGQFPSFLAHSLGMPGQPLIPPQGQYAGLAQQVHQQHLQQQILGGQPLPQGIPGERLGNYLQGGPSPGVSPVTQSSGSTFATKPSGAHGETRPALIQQGMQGPLQQSRQDQEQNQDLRSPIGSVQIATAVPIRQVERSPNSSSGHFSGSNSPPGDSTRGASASVVNQIEIGGPKRSILDAQDRARSSSNPTPQHHPVHIASLQTPVRKPVQMSPPRNHAHPTPQETTSVDTEQQHSAGQRSTQDSPSTRRVSQNPSTVSQNASQLTLSTSPAPSQEQQPAPPGAPPKTTDRLPGEDSAASRQLQPNQDDPSLPASQNSVYRPSGQQFAQPPRTWGAAEQGRPYSQDSFGQSSQRIQTGQNGQYGQPSQLGLYSSQYAMQGRPPQDLMMSPPPQVQRPDKEGTFARMLKTSKNFVQEKTQPSNPKTQTLKQWGGEKESRSAKLLNAFGKKSKQTEVASPAPPQGPPGGPRWATAPAQAPQRPQEPPASPQPAPEDTKNVPERSSGPSERQRSPQNTTPASPPQQLVTQGLQAMPSKAQQLLGQPPNSMYQAPADQPLPKARSSAERANSQPYQDYQDERQAPGKSTPPLSPDEIQGAPAAQQVPPQAPQPPPGSPSIGSLPPSSHGSKGALSQQPQPQQQPGHNPMASLVNAKSRAHMLKQQIASSSARQQPTEEPQYAQVPIPQGYAPVYSGRAVSSAPTPAYGQPYPGIPYQGQPQQWMHPAMVQSMVVPIQAPQGMPPQGQGTPPQGVPPHLAREAYTQYPPYHQQGTPPPGMVAGYPPPQQQYVSSHQTSPSPPVQGQMIPPVVPMQQPFQQPQQAMHQPTQQFGQQSAHQISQQAWQQSLPQPGWPQPVAAPATGQEQQAMAAPQQTPPPSQSAGAEPPQQIKPVNSEVARPTPASGVPSATQAQKHFSLVPDVDKASPVLTNNDKDQPQIEQPAPVKHESGGLLPEQQTVPRSAFAVHGGGPYNRNQLQPSQGGFSNENLTPQRQISAASEVSSMTNEPTTGKNSPDTQRVQIVRHPAESAQPASPERQWGVTLKDVPLPPKVDTPVTATPADRDDDIYGATPRQSVKGSPVVDEQQQQHQNTVVEHVIVSDPLQDEAGSKFAGMPNAVGGSNTSETGTKIATPSPPHFVVDAPPVVVEPVSTYVTTLSPPAATATPAPSPPASALVGRSKSPLPLPDEGNEPEPPSPTDSELGRSGEMGSAVARRAQSDGDSAAGAGVALLNGKPVQSSQEIFEEHKRKQLIRDMEEKIAVVMPEQQDLLEPARRKKEDEMPTMSATSYPGQEWNPYGEGFEDDDE